MKSTFALIGAYAALASAFTPGRHLHFPRGNGTMTSSTSSSTSSIGSTSTSISAPLTTAPSSAGAGITTLTVKTTRTSTIISCAATVTNCPAGKPEMSNIPESDRQTKTVTETIDLTTTVCPVAEASTISQQIIEKHNSAAPSQTQGGGQVTKTTVIVPTAVTSTYQSTVSPEETVTTTATSTTTKTVTITRSRTPANTAASSESKADAIGGGSPATVTVTVAQTTVTAPASTVYVTVPCAAASSGSPVQNKEVDDTPYGSTATSGNAGSNVTTQLPAVATSSPCETDVTTTVEMTVTVVPYPSTNGTSTTSTGAAASSGFARLRR